MRFTCEKNQLLQGLNIASRTVAVKSSLSLIEGILCRAGNGIFLTGYNMETGITYEIDADVKEPGECILPAKLFGDIVRRLPEGPVTVVVDPAFKVSIRAGFASFTISAEDAVDYAELPDVNDGRPIQIPQSKLKELISGTIFAVADNQARPIHNGVKFEVSDTAVTTDLTELALPVRVVFTNEYARYGLSAITTLDTDFELAGAFFGEALGSATTYEACSGEKLLTALHASSIYLDLEAPTPLEVLSRILGVNDAPESSLLRVTRLVLCPAENGATLYLQDANQGFFVSRTAISSATLREALASLDGNGTDFAFSLSGEFSQLSPYTLIFSEPPQRYTLSASNALTDQATFLRLAEFNPHTESGYTDSSGNTIIKEVYGTLRLEPDGSVFYQGADEAEAGSIYYVSAAPTGKPTMLEAVAGAQRLAFTLLRDVSGDAELYLSEIDSSNKRFTVSFDYAVGGTPLRFSDGSHAATVTIEDQTITEFSLHCRSYTLSDSPALLLPIRQAAAIAGSKYLGAELHVCYDEHGADTVGVGWFAD